MVTQILGTRGCWKNSTDKQRCFTSFVIVWGSKFIFGLLINQLDIMKTSSRRCIPLQTRMYWFYSNNVPHYNDTKCPWRLKSLTPRLLVQLFVHVLNKEGIKAPHYWGFCKGNHQWPMDSPHKGPETRKAFPCHGVIYHNVRRSSDSWKKITGCVRYWPVVKTIAFVSRGHRSIKKTQQSLSWYIRMSLPDFARIVGS